MIILGLVVVSLVAVVVLSGSGGSSDSDAVVGVPLDRGEQCGHFGVR